jgi:mono/diheme cytochrome c family protein
MWKKFHRLCWGFAALIAAARLFAADMTNQPAVPPAVYAPKPSPANGLLPDNVIAWNDLEFTTNVPADLDIALFHFGFTNISPDSVTILSAHASCGCTQPHLPSTPWTIPAGSGGAFDVTINLAGKTGWLFKSVTVSTDKGTKDLFLRVNIQPPPKMTDDAIVMSKADRQAVFKGDCASCHVKNGEGKYGKALFDADCAICHETAHRATMVPDLHNLTVPTNDEFWRTWIAHGKPGSLMPAFSTAEGGPLNDMQIASVAAYLHYTIPSHVVTLVATNSVPAR